MTLAELANETLVQKHRRLMQEKCRHEEVYSSTVVSPAGAFTNSFCLDCGFSQSEKAGTCQCCGTVTRLICGPSRFGEQTWACDECWDPGDHIERTVSE